MKNALLAIAVVLVANAGAGQDWAAKKV